MCESKCARSCTARGKKGKRDSERERERERGTDHSQLPAVLITLADLAKEVIKSTKESHKHQ